MTSNSDPSNVLPLPSLSDDDFDVILQVGEGHNSKEYHVHSAILQECSPYFKGAFSSNWIVRKDNMITFNSPTLLQLFLT